MSNFDLSIIIPFYNGELFINTLLKTLESSYNVSKKQTKLEIIIILDSPDSKIESLEYQLKKILLTDFFSIVRIYKNAKNIGVAHSRNLGLQKSKAQFITFIDQDDFVEEKYFSVLENTISTESKFDFYLLNGFYVNGHTMKKIPLYHIRPKINLRRIIRQNRIKTPGMIVFKKNTLTDNLCKFFDVDPSLKGCDDWHLLIDLYFKKPELEYYYISNRIFNYLFHGKNYSNDLHISILGSIKVLSNFEALHPLLEVGISQTIHRLEFEYSFYNSIHKIKTVLKDPKGFFLFLILRFTDLNRLLFSTKRIFNSMPFRIS